MVEGTFCCMDFYFQASLPLIHAECATIFNLSLLRNNSSLI